jgi:dUTP pyrophosphatase
VSQCRSSAEKTTPQVRLFRTDAQAVIPKQGTDGAVGYDLTSTKTITINPGEVATIPCGISIEPPPSHAVLVCSRSGLGKRGLVVAHGIGVIDPDYRGSLDTPMRNLGQAPITVEEHDRFAQLVVVPIAKAAFMEVNSLSSSERGDRGFGSTGR